MMLEGIDYSVNRASMEKRYLKIKEDKPDLIILDLLLNELTGDAFLKQLKSDQGVCQHSTHAIESSFSPHSYKTIFEIDPTLVFLKNCLPKKVTCLN